MRPMYLIGLLFSSLLYYMIPPICYGDSNPSPIVNSLVSMPKDKFQEYARFALESLQILQDCHFIIFFLVYALLLLSCLALMFIWDKWQGGKPNIWEQLLLHPWHTIFNSVVFYSCFLLYWFAGAEFFFFYTVYLLVPAYGWYFKRRGDYAYVFFTITLLKLVRVVFFLYVIIAIILGIAAFRSLIATLLDIQQAKMSLVTNDALTDASVRGVYTTTPTLPTPLERITISAVQSLEQGSSNRGESSHNLLLPATQDVIRPENPPQTRGWLMKGIASLTDQFGFAGARAAFHYKVQAAHGQAALGAVSTTPPQAVINTTLEEHNVTSLEFVTQGRVNGGPQIPLKVHCQHNAAAFNTMVMDSNSLLNNNQPGVIARTVTNVFCAMGHNVMKQGHPESCVYTDMTTNKLVHPNSVVQLGKVPSIAVGRLSSDVGYHSLGIFPDIPESPVTPSGTRNIF